MNRLCPARSRSNLEDRQRPPARSICLLFFVCVVVPAWCLAQDTAPNDKNADKKAKIAGLIDQLNAGLDSARNAATTALGETKDPAVIEKLIERISHPDSATNFAAGAALEECGELLDLNAVKRIVEKAFGHSNVNLRYTSARAVGKSKAIGVTDLLIATLKSENGLKRESAVLALRERNAAKSIPALIAALEDPVPEVRTESAEAVALITHKDFGTDHASWKSWWMKDGVDRYPLF